MAITSDKGASTDFAKVEVNVRDRSGTTYTVTADDDGKLLRFTAATTVVCTIPVLTSGFNIGWLQGGAGELQFTADTSAKINNRQSHTKSAGIHGVGSIILTHASGGVTEYVLGGDTA